MIDGHLHFLFSPKKRFLVFCCKRYKKYMNLVCVCVTKRSLNVTGGGGHTTSFNGFNENQKIRFCVILQYFLSNQSSAAV